MNKEIGCQWHFCEDLDGYSFGTGVAPQKNFRKATVAASITRESLQNSIDAAVKYPVRVEYTKRYLAVNDYPFLFGIEPCSDGKYLTDHFNGIVDSFSENDEENINEYKQKADYVESLKDNNTQDKTIPYLRISDSNTSGMNYIPSNNKGTFASFVRSAGRNDKKSKGSAGSCGVGKGAYIQMSKSNTLLVSSRSEEQTLFEGYMLAVSHYVDGKGYQPYAFYDNNNHKPVCNETNIPVEFLRREIGTDINIIGIDDEDWDQQVEAMIIAVLRNFWLAIHEGILEVVIEGIEITKSTLPSLLEKYFGERPDGSQERTYNPFIYYQIVASKSEGKIVHIRKEIPPLGEVIFYLNKAKTGNGRILYMRESRMLIFSRVEPLYNQINGVFVCTGKNGIGNEILKRTENESHNEWKAKPGDEEAKQAIELINKFINKCLEDELGSVTSTTVDIKRLAGRLPISTEPIFDEDYDGEIDEEELSGNTITETLETTDAKKVQPHKEKKESASKVHIRKKKTVTKDKTGDEFEESNEGGEGPQIPSTYIPTDNPPKPGPGPFPGPQPNEELPSKTTQNIESQSGEQKKTVSISSFEPCAFVKKEEGDYLYFVRIKSAQEHENANIVVTVDGESGDDHLEIKESSVGNPNGHTIQGVHLSKGFNEFTFKFKDNEKVSIRISAYEFKD